MPRSKPKSSERTFPIAIVVWEDAAFFGDPNEARSIYCHSVGYLLEDGKKHVQIAMDISELSPRDVLTIPRAYVRQVRVVEKDTIKVAPFRLEVKDGKPTSRKRS